MRIILSVFIFALALSGPLYAEDDFGARFNQAAPKGFEDPQTQDGNTGAIADIEPAAGDDAAMQADNDDDRRHKAPPIRARATGQDER